MHTLALHYRGNFRRVLCLTLVTYDNIFTDASSGWDPTVFSLELVPQMACRPDSSPSALASEPSPVAATCDKALHSPELPTTDTIISAIRHRHDCCRRVFAI
jgi:hypothetical protein